MSRVDKRMENEDTGEGNCVVIEVKKIFRYREGDGKLNPSEDDNEERMFIILPGGEMISVKSKYVKAIIPNYAGICSK